MSLDKTPPVEKWTIEQLVQVREWCKQNLDDCRDIVDLLTTPRDYSWDEDLEEVLMALDQEGSDKPEED